MGWLKQNAPSIEAAAALITALVAVAAIVGVKLQIDANAAQQASQSARDIFREHLTLSIVNPQFSEPDVCTLIASDQRPAYAAFVEHLLYTSEQILATQTDWNDAISERLAPHIDYFCSTDGWNGYTQPVTDLIALTRTEYCSAEPTCQ